MPRFSANLSFLFGELPLADRFKAAVSCRSVNDMTAEMLTGDIAGPLFGKYEYGANPWEDPELYRRHSPIAYAANIRLYRSDICLPGSSRSGPGA